MGRANVFSLLDALRSAPTSDPMIGSLMEALRETKYVPKSVVPGAKLVRVNERAPGMLYPLYVRANENMPVGEWLWAEAGKAAEGGGVKSKISTKKRELAFRPGFHASDYPFSHHIGALNDQQKAVKKEIDQLRNELYRRKKLFRERFKSGKAGELEFERAKKTLQKEADLEYPDWVTVKTIRRPNEVWVDVDMPNDINWQSLADALGINKVGDLVKGKAQIKDRIPYGGFYRYKTNPSMVGDWMIGGNMKIKRLIPDDEAAAISRAGPGNPQKLVDLPRLEPPPKWVLDSWKNGGDLSGF